MDPTDALNAPDTTTKASPVTAVHHSLVAASGEQCPSCGNPVASDQRYCLHCGQRCGEPRLPFMNAVTFMDAMKHPAATAPPSPPKAKRRSLSPNAALITGVGTLLLAMGVGVLIGQSGNDTAAPQQAAAPIVIKGGTGEEANTASTVGGTGKSSGKSSKSSKKSEKGAKAAADSGEGAEEVLKPAGDVKLPPATVQPGEKCEGDAAGCKGGEFTGEFFGE